MLAGCGGKKTESNTTDKNAADAVTEAASQAADEGKVLNIYCWNEEFKSRITAHYPGYEEVDATHGKIGDVDVVSPVVESVVLPPHPASIPASMVAHNNVLTIFFFIVFFLLMIYCLSMVLL